MENYQSRKAKANLKQQHCLHSQHFQQRTGSNNAQQTILDLPQTQHCVTRDFNTHHSWRRNTKPAQYLHFPVTHNHCMSIFPHRSSGTLKISEKQFSKAAHHCKLACRSSGESVQQC